MTEIQKNINCGKPIIYYFLSKALVSIVWVVVMMLPLEWWPPYFTGSAIVDFKFVLLVRNSFHL